MSLRVASYNILADAYLKREWYPNTSAAHLEVDRRRRLLLTRLLELDADILCLQEVEQPVHEAVAAHLGKAGYGAVFVKKAGRRPDGCGTYHRAAVAPLVGHRSMHYRDGGEDRGASGHVALITEFEMESRAVGVINTHLRWSGGSVPTHERWSYRQVQELLDEVIAPSDAAWIVCGDYNVEIGSPTVDLLRERGFVNAYGDEPPATCNPNQRAKAIDFLLHSPSLVAEPCPLPAIDGATPLPSDAEPSDHLPISAVFRWAGPG